MPTLRQPTPTDRRLERLQQAYLCLQDTLPQDTHTQERLYQAYQDLREQAHSPQVAPPTGGEPYRVVYQALRREAGW